MATNIFNLNFSSPYALLHSWFEKDRRRAQLCGMVAGFRFWAFYTVARPPDNNKDDLGAYTNASAQAPSRETKAGPRSWLWRLPPHDWHSAGPQLCWSTSVLSYTIHRSASHHPIVLWLYCPCTVPVSNLSCNEGTAHEEDSIRAALLGLGRIGTCRERDGT